MITLLPTTNRHRQLIRDHGDQWTLTREMPCATFGGQQGLEVQSLDHTHIRWVRITDVK